MNDNNSIEVVNIRLVQDKTLYSNEKIDSPESAVHILSNELKMYDREVAAIINIQADGRPININIISMGGLDQAIIEPAQVFKSAILSNAKDIMLLHNHPSGTAIPSRADIQVTKRLVECGKLMNIHLLDHIIIGDDIYSFREHDMLEANITTHKFIHESNIAELMYKKQRQPIDIVLEIEH